jgi:hypothetical protein
MTFISCMMRLMLKSAYFNLNREQLMNVISLWIRWNGWWPSSAVWSVWYWSILRLNWKQLITLINCLIRWILEHSSPKLKTAGNHHQLFDKVDIRAFFGLTENSCKDFYNRVLKDVVCFKHLTEAYTSTLRLLTYLLTDSLICPHNTQNIFLMAEGEGLSHPLVLLKCRCIFIYFK